MKRRELLRGKPCTCDAPHPLPVRFARSVRRKCEVAAADILFPPRWRPSQPPPSADERYRDALTICRRFDPDSIARVVDAVLDSDRRTRVLGRRAARQLRNNLNLYAAHASCVSQYFDHH